MLWYLLADGGRGRISILALKAVKETVWVITLWVAASVTEKLPATHLGCAVFPWPEPAQCTVTPIPLTLLILTLWVTDPITCTLLTLHIWAGGSRWGFYEILAVSSSVAFMTMAGSSERVVGVLNTHASILALARGDFTVRS